MQNLLWKFAVLAGVIGGSCLAVWQAHQALHRGADESDAAAFTEFEADDSNPADPFDEPSSTPAPLQGRLEPVPDFDDEPEPTMATAPPPVSHSHSFGSASPASPEPPADGFFDFESASTGNPSPTETTGERADLVRNNRMIFLPSGNGERNVSASTPRGFPAFSEGVAPDQAPEQSEESDPTPAPLQGESAQAESLADFGTASPSEDGSRIPQPEPLADARPSDLSARSSQTASNPLTLFGPDHRQATPDEDPTDAASAPAMARSSPDVVSDRISDTSPPQTEDGIPSGRIRLPDSSLDAVASNGAIELASATSPPPQDSPENGEVLPARMLFDGPPPSENERPQSIEDQDEVLPRMPINTIDADPAAPPEKEAGFNDDAPVASEQRNPFVFDSTPSESEPAPEPTTGHPDRKSNPFTPEFSPEEASGPDAQPSAADLTEPQEPEPTIAFPESDESPRNFPALPIGPGFEGDLGRGVGRSDSVLESETSTRQPPSAQPLPDRDLSDTQERSAPRGLPFPSFDDDSEPAQPNDFGETGLSDAAPALADDEALPSMTLPAEDASQPPFAEDASPEPVPSVADDEEVVPRSLPQPGEGAFPIELADEPDARPASDPVSEDAASSLELDETGDEPAGRMSTTGSELLGDAEYDPDIPSDPQSPELTIEKIAPAEAVVGEPLIYAIRIRNVGGSPARDVVVEDRIPRGTKLEGTIPQAVLTDGKLTWDLGTLPAGEERKVQLKVTPTEAGQIGSVATVSFAAAVSTSIRVTAPMLSIEMDGPDEAVVGERIPYRFVIRNTGEGNAKQVYIRAILPEGIRHPGGNDIEYKVGDLPAGESREIDLILEAAEPGTVTPHVLVTIDGQTHDEARADLRVIRSPLELARTGPSRRFVGRPAEYVNQVTNQTSRTLQHITVTEHLPEGVEPAPSESSSVQVASATTAPTQGEWDPQQRTISWYVRELGPGQAVELKMMLVATRTGTHAGKVAAHEGDGSRVELESTLEVKGFADLGLDLSTDRRTVLVGEQVSLQLRLKNEGTAPAGAVSARFVIPPGLKFVNARGPVDFEREGNVIRFATLEEFPVDAEESFHLALTAAEPGTTKVTATLESADYSEPIVTEEPVRIIQDSP